MVSYNKMSKKQKKEYNKRKRTFWTINPVTRKPPSPKAYDRKKEKRKWKDTYASYFLWFRFY